MLVWSLVLFLTASTCFHYLFVLIVRVATARAVMATATATAISIGRLNLLSFYEMFDYLHKISNDKNFKKSYKVFSNKMLIDVVRFFFVLMPECASIIQSDSVLMLCNYNSLQANSQKNNFPFFRTNFQSIRNFVPLGLFRENFEVF